MKCEYCLGPLSLEDEVCPHCGRPNKHAKQHIRDMKRYQNEFEDTKNYVYEKTGRYTAISVRVVIMAVLIVFILLMLFLGANVWEIRSAWQKASAKRHYKEYSQIMDSYLEEENYLDFNAFCYEKGIHSYEEPYREKYGLVIQISNSYSNLQDALWNYCFLENEEVSGSILDMTADSLEYFYRYYLNEDGYYTDLYGDSELFRKTAEVMEYNVEQILITFGNFTREEAEALPSMSKAKRAVLLEEKLEAELQNE